MKKTITALTILFMCTLSAFAQNPMLLADSGAVWRILNADMSTPSGSAFMKTEFRIKGMVEFNGKTYHHVAFTQDTRSEKDSAFAFREDNGKVFFRPLKLHGHSNGPELIIDSTGEILVYDFNLQVGDSISYHVTSFGQLTYTVTKIDTITDPHSIQRRRWHLQSNQCGNSPEWIEGIGSTDGLFHPSYCPFEQVETLVCYKKNGEVIFDHWTTKCSERMFGVGIKEEEIFTLKAFPNPASETVTIKLHSPESKLEIFDLSGKKYQVQVISQSGNSIIINTSELKNGCYFVRSLSESTIGRSLLLIQH